MQCSQGYGQVKPNVPSPNVHRYLTLIEKKTVLVRDETTAGRFQRVRQDHARETAEDYAEMVLELGGGGHVAVRPADLARALGVSHVTVLRALDRLIRSGIITRDENQGIRLSPKGRRLGEHARDRHQLVVAFLESLGVPPEIAAIDAEGIEHHASAVTLERMAAFLETKTKS
jgi:DtxR family transcriptional regulator, manganese transport regulator